MIPYPSLAAAESALNRSLTYAETIWFKYSATIPDPLLYNYYTLFPFVIFTLVPLPFALLELYWPSVLKPFKIQPKVYLSKSEFLECYKNAFKVLFLVGCPLQLLSYPSIKFLGIRTGLPLPSIWEIAAQLVVYFLVEDFGYYWLHRWLHGKWGYEKIHKVHHESTAPIGFAAAYAHWGEVLILGIPSFLGPAIVPGHMITLWLWIALRQIEALDIHSGYDLPLNLTKFIPFYGGAEYHDYHHYVGEKSQSNFASVFTYCDYIYGTDKGYRYRKACLAKMREQLRLADQNGVDSSLQNQKSD